MLNFGEKYFDGADPAAPAAPGQRDLLAGAILGYPGRDAERMQYWRRPGEGRGRVSRSAYAALA